VEDNLSSVKLGKRHPKDKDELEDVIEWEPIGSIDSTLNNGQEGINHPVRQPLNIICGASSEECMEGVITGDNEAGKIDEKLASDVEKHQEEIRPNQTQEGVDFGNRGLSLQVVEHRVFGELLVQLCNGVLSTILKGGHSQFPFVDSFSPPIIFLLFPFSFLFSSKKKNECQLIWMAKALLLCGEQVRTLE